MDNWTTILNTFLLQAQKGDLKTASYPNEWSDLRMRVSFGMGMPARVPWIAFVAPEMEVRRGFYPVYLYYKELGTVILSYGISETEEFVKTWPVDIMNSSVTITAYFDKDVPRYGDSFVFKAYKVESDKKGIKLSYADTGAEVTDKDIEADLTTILEYYKKTVSITSTSASSEFGQGLFYMEKQLEDFLVHNWEKTELGKKYELIVEDGELVSQQYRTDIGNIDILAKDKASKSFVVIELKKNQTSDDTIGQLTRYMGWVKRHKGDNNVMGVIIAGQHDRKLEYALKMVPNAKVYLYEVNFKLSELNV